MQRFLNPVDGIDLREGVLKQTRTGGYASTRFSPRHVMIDKNHHIYLPRISSKTGLTKLSNLCII